MPDLIEAIERFEAALKTAGPELVQAESSLCEMLGQAMAEDHLTVCEPCAEGCTEEDFSQRDDL